MASPHDLLLLIPLLLLLLFMMSSNYVLCGKIVTHLPGYSGPLPFHLETGYVNVESSELFYYFLQSEGNPSEDPLILWFTGGPGCSGFSGLVLEIGPLRFVSTEYNGSIPTLVYNPYSWTKLASIIFLDYPVGSGFSFTSRPKGHVPDDTTTSIQCYKFLRKWYGSHPQFLSNPLYMGGDSYGGKIAPIVAQYIADGNDVPPFFNLKGYLIGNARTGEAVDFNSRLAFANGVGILSDEVYKEIMQVCGGEEDYYFNDNRQCFLTMNKFRKLCSEIDLQSILEPNCPSLGDKFIELPSLQAPLHPNVKCRNYAYYLAVLWANNDSTKEALHIKKGSVDSWIRCSMDIYLRYRRDIKSNMKYHLNLTSRGYRALVYSGDKDMAVPFLGTIAWIKSLNFSVVEKWQSWHVSGQVAGYTETYANNLTFATVKNAGHTAPEYQPEVCFAMFGRWLSHKPL